MPCRLHLPLAAALLAGSVSLHAQEAVVGASDPEALFHSNDPTLNRNKQIAYHIVKDLLEAGHWELADKYLTERYIQHNPNAASGRNGVEVLHRGPEGDARANPDRKSTRLNSVTATSRMPSSA